MKRSFCFALLFMPTLCLNLYAQSARTEAELWTGQKEKLCDKLEKLILPPKGTSTSELQDVFPGKVTEEKTDKLDTTHIDIGLFVYGDGHVYRCKMYCEIVATAVKGKVVESHTHFPWGGPLNIEGKQVTDPYKMDYKLVGLLNGYLAWKERLAQASWNRPPNKPDTGDGK